MQVSTYEEEINKMAEIIVNPNLSSKSIQNIGEHELVASIVKIINNQVFVIDKGFDDGISLQSHFAILGSAQMIYGIDESPLEVIREPISLFSTIMVNQRVSVIRLIDRSIEPHLSLKHRGEFQIVIIEGFGYTLTNQIDDAIKTDKLKKYTLKRGTRLVLMK